MSFENSNKIKKRPDTDPDLHKLAYRLMGRYKFIDLDTLHWKVLNEGVKFIQMEEDRWFLSPLSNTDPTRGFLEGKRKDYLTMDKTGKLGKITKEMYDKLFK